MVVDGTLVLSGIFNNPDPDNYPVTVTWEWEAVHPTADTAAVYNVREIVVDNYHQSIPASCTVILF